MGKRRGHEFANGEPGAVDGGNHLAGQRPRFAGAGRRKKAEPDHEQGDRRGHSMRRRLRTMDCHDAGVLR